MIELLNWVKHHNISKQAYDDLRVLLGTNVDSTVGSTSKGKSESEIQNLCRYNGSHKGWRLWRNNVGVAKDVRGIPIRYGLCNESKQMNIKLKSSDLIGIRPVEITQDMVGQTIGQFVALEVKHGDWVYGGSKHEQAQFKFISLVISLGGHAKFVNNAGNIE